MRQPSVNNLSLLEEFERQTETLIRKEYPRLAGMPENRFRDLLKPLASLLSSKRIFETDTESGHLSFVIVIKNTLVKTSAMMSRTDKNGRQGTIKLFPLSPDDFQPTDSVIVPRCQTYLMFDIDRGKNTLNMSPEEALPRIISQKRTPLTVDEGVALITHFPEFLMNNNCFSLLGSRHPGDKRVPAVWINAEKHPHLGWCWNGNPHTWLGSASCGKRVC